MIEKIQYYPSAKQIVETLPLFKETTITVLDKKTFRKYLHEIAFRKGKVFTTKKISTTELFIMRIK